MKLSSLNTFRCPGCDFLVLTSLEPHEQKPDCPGCEANDWRFLEAIETINIEDPTELPAVLDQLFREGLDND